MEDKKITESKKPWPFLWSKISLCLAITSWLLILVGIPITLIFNLPESTPGCYFAVSLSITVLLSLLCAGCAFLSGITSTLGFILHKIETSSKATAFGGLGWSAFYFLLAFLLFFSVPKYNPELAYEVICKSNIKVIALGLDRYHENNTSWPDKVNWCDLIKPYTEEEDDRIFRCPKDKTGSCSYAMNKNIPADAEKLPDDLVILFEAAPGWNQTGGPDDIITDRHGKPGAYIAFADGRAEFVPVEDIPNLRWTIDNSSVER